MCYFNSFQCMHMALFYSSPYIYVCVSLFLLWNLNNFQTPLTFSRGKSHRLLNISSEVRSPAGQFCCKDLEEIYRALLWNLKIILAPHTWSRGLAGVFGTMSGHLCPRHLCPGKKCPRHLVPRQSCPKIVRAIATLVNDRIILISSQ